MSVDAELLARHPLSILGPTASGKSSLAMALVAMLADLGHTAELVSIDSMQVYRGMNVGTATPTVAEQAEVRHHLIDVVDPWETFTVSEFQRLANDAITDITARGAIPILVGGTGLYLRSVIDNLTIPGQFPDVLAELENEPDTVALHRRLQDLDPVAADRMEPNNRRRVLRALEVTLGSGQPFSSFGPGLETYPASRFVQVALRWDRDQLDQRIEQRYQHQLDEGFFDEVRWLAENSPSRTARQALGYRELLDVLEGEMTLDEAVELAIVRTRQFARKQLRWFRRDPRVQWIDAPPEPATVLRMWSDSVRSLRD